MFNVPFNAGPTRSAIPEAAKSLDNLADVADIAEYMLDETRLWFVKDVGPDGTLWAPKRQSALDRYERLGQGKLIKPLIGAGKLRRLRDQ